MHLHLCAENGIDFALGHALYMKAIHGGMFPNAYAYPKTMSLIAQKLARTAFYMLKRKKTFTSDKFYGE